MFASSSSVQINGGNFYDVAGNVHFKSIQFTEHDEAQMALETGSAQNIPDDAGVHRLVGAERNQGRRGDVRMLPYDISQRSHILSRSLHLISSDNPRLKSGKELQLPPIDPLRVWDGHETSDTPSRIDDLPVRPRRRARPNVGQRSSGSESRDCLPPISALVSFLPDSGPSQYHFMSEPQSAGDAFSSNRLSTNHYQVHPGNIEQRQSRPGHIPAYRPLRSLAGIHTPFPLERPVHEPKTSINGGTFIGGNVNNIQGHGETGLHILHRAIAGDAFHDSAERYPQPQCHPDTRTKMLDVLQRWARGTEPPINWTSEDNEYYHPPEDEDSDSNEDDDDDDDDEIH
ncbi:hypothetical protein B0H11DRAFT_2272374 [Mycena galericulata]|nr:hypothetical protein B0H11DRAFT_2272374 [Mycena galericulata]